MLIRFFFFFLYKNRMKSWVNFLKTKLKKMSFCFKKKGRKKKVKRSQQHFFPRHSGGIRINFHLDSKKFLQNILSCNLRRSRLKFQLDYALDDSDVLVARKQELTETIRDLEKEVEHIKLNQKLRFIWCKQIIFSHCTKKSWTRTYLESV